VNQSEVVMKNLCSEHTSGEQLERYLLRQTTENETDVVETHLMICASCQDRLARLEEYRSAIRDGLALIASEKEQLGRDGQILEESPKRGWLTNVLRGNWGRLSMVPAAATLLLAGTFLAGTMWRSPGPAEIWLAAERGSQTTEATAEHGRRLQLHLDTSGLPGGETWVEIVDSKGNTISEQRAQRVSNQLSTEVSPLPSGRYYVRVYGTRGGHLDPDQLLREFGLQVR
jgi:hypothetical protein